jgi:hypothetical protein
MMTAASPAFFHTPFVMAWGYQDMVNEALSDPQVGGSEGIRQQRRQCV